MAPSIFDEAEIIFPEVKSINEIDTSSVYFSKEDLLAVTVHIGKRLTDKESTSDPEVIELLNLYTKHFETTRNLLIQPGSNYEEITAISYVPNSYRDHSDMRNDLMKLLYNRGLTPLSKECSKYNAIAMIDNIILFDYKIGLENIKVLKTAPDEFLYLSVDGDFCAKLAYAQIRAVKVSALLHVAYRTQ